MAGHTRTFIEGRPVNSLNMTISLPKMTYLSNLSNFKTAYRDNFFRQYALELTYNFVTIGRKSPTL
jgi:hypothetical protein